MGEAGRGWLGPANLPEVVEEALEEDGCRDDDSADGGHGPRRRLVQRPRAVPAAGGSSAVAAHFLSALAAAALMACRAPKPRREGVGEWRLESALRPKEGKTEEE